MARRVRLPRNQKDRDRLQLINDLGPQMMALVNRHDETVAVNVSGVTFSLVMQKYNHSLQDARSASYKSYGTCRK